MTLRLRNPMTDGDEASQSRGSRRSYNQTGRGSAHVDLVIAGGGDGTSRAVADALAHTGIPVGLVPAGTGNLPARNLDLPLEEVDAIEVALSGQVRQLDLVKIIVDDRAPEYFGSVSMP
jgi:diacylglycerol kinase family enzyme